VLDGSVEMLVEVALGLLKEASMPKGSGQQ
jgi:hypothetical protein